MRAGSVPSTRGVASHRTAGRRHSSVSLGHHPNASNTSRGTSRGKGGVASVVAKVVAKLVAEVAAIPLEEPAAESTSS
jgi:hypothetical protein